MLAPEELSESQNSNCPALCMVNRLYEIFVSLATDDPSGLNGGRTFEREIEIMMP
jgi:hypothetical protein